MAKLKLTFTNGKIKATDAVVKITEELGIENYVKRDGVSPSHQFYKIGWEDKGVFYTFGKIKVSSEMEEQEVKDLVRQLKAAKKIINKRKDKIEEVEFDI